MSWPLNGYAAHHFILARAVVQHDLWLDFFSPIAAACLLDWSTKRPGMMQCWRTMLWSANFFDEFCISFSWKEYLLIIFVDWVGSPHQKQLWSTMLWRVEKEPPLRHFVIASVERAIFKLDTRGVRVNNMHSQKLIAAICPKKGDNFYIMALPPFKTDYFQKLYQRFCLRLQLMVHHLSVGFFTQPKSTVSVLPQ